MTEERVREIVQEEIQLFAGRLSNEIGRAVGVSRAGLPLVNEENVTDAFAILSRALWQEQHGTPAGS